MDLGPNPVKLGPNPVVLGTNPVDLGPNPVDLEPNPDDLKSSQTNLGILSIGVEQSTNVVTSYAIFVFQITLLYCIYIKMVIKPFES